MCLQCYTRFCLGGLCCNTGKALIAFVSKRVNNVTYTFYGSLTRYEILWVALRREHRERFPRHWLQRNPLISDPGMHHGHIGIANPRWRGKLSRHSRRIRTRNFTHLERGPLDLTICIKLTWNSASSPTPIPLYITYISQWKRWTSQSYIVRIISVLQYIDGIGWGLFYVLDRNNKFLWGWYNSICFLKCLIFWSIVRVLFWLNLICKIYHND